MWSVLYFNNPIKHYPAGISTYMLTSALLFHDVIMVAEAKYSAMTVVRAKCSLQRPTPPNVYGPESIYINTRGHCSPSHDGGNRQTHHWPLVALCYPFFADVSIFDDVAKRGGVRSLQRYNNDGERQFRCACRRSEDRLDNRY